MLIEVRHVSTYAYGTTARYSIQSLRLTPPSFEGQHVLGWEIKAPGIEKALTFCDGFGNLAHLAALAANHDGITIEAGGVVETEDRAGIVRGLTDPAPVRVYLRETAKTRPDKGIRDLARSAGNRDTIDRLHALMRAVREAVAYEIGATHEHTNAAEALADGKGVCQDHAHVFISAARVLGVPARYVNGYFLAGTAEDQRIAALETDDALALARQAHHQGVDVVLLAGRPEAGLADQQLACLAAGKIEHVARYQIVEQDHVGRLQGAHRTQRQQLRIARPGADQRDRAVLDRAAQALDLGDQALEVALAGVVLGVGDRLRGEQLPELAPAGKRQARGLHRIDDLLEIESQVDQRESSADNL